jgi:hypothetical protein
MPDKAELEEDQVEPAEVRILILIYSVIQE